MAPNVITILFAGGVKAGVKLFRRAHGVQHANVFGQKSIQCNGQPMNGQLGFGSGNFKMRDHAERVYAGIRAAGTVDARLAGKVSGEGFFDFLLHADADFLQLPALIRCAVVGNDEFVFE